MESADTDLYTIEKTFIEHIWRENMFLLSLEAVHARGTVSLPMRL